MPGPIVRVKTSRIIDCVAMLVALGLVFLNLDSAAMAVPKKGGYYLASHYRAVKKQVKTVSVTMPNQEATIAKLREPKYFGKLYLLQECWQCPQAEEAKTIFTITILVSKNMPRRVAQRFFNDTITEVYASMTSYGGDRHPRS